MITRNVLNVCGVKIVIFQSISRPRYFFIPPGVGVVVGGVGVGVGVGVNFASTPAEDVDAGRAASPVSRETDTGSSVDSFNGLKVSGVCVGVGGRETLRPTRVVPSDPCATPGCAAKKEDAEDNDADDEKKLSISSSSPTRSTGVLCTSLCFLRTAPLPPPPPSLLVVLRAPTLTPSFPPVPPRVDVILLLSTFISSGQRSSNECKL